MILIKLLGEGIKNSSHTVATIKSPWPSDLKFNHIVSIINKRI